MKLKYWTCDGCHQTLQGIEDNDEVEASTGGQRAAAINAEEDNMTIDYITTQEAALMLRVSKQTIRNYIKGKKLKVYRAGTQLVRLDRAEVQGFLKSEPETN
jgi:excisionase family DNA binding protein